jgi:hypothetical protein
MLLCYLVLTLEGDGRSLPTDEICQPARGKTLWRLLLGCEPVALDRATCLKAKDCLSNTLLPAQAPQLWHGIAQHLGQAAPDVLVLIHPMHMAPAQHSHRALQVQLLTVNMPPSSAEPW